MVKKHRRIRDMETGEVGYAVPWAYEGGQLKDSHIIWPRPGGTATMRVECIAPGEYALPNRRMAQFRLRWPFVCKRWGAPVLVALGAAMMLLGVAAIASGGTVCGLGMVIGGVVGLMKGTEGLLQ